MNEGSLFFDDQGKVQQTLRRITKRLNDLGIPYAVAGGMCLFHHGFRRFTEDVDLLVTREGLKLVHEHLDGLGFTRLFTGSKGMRDAETRVKIDFLIEGDYPGDGKPKPIAFPQPLEVAEEFDGICYLNLKTLVTLKMASGLSNEERRKDIVDVEQLTLAINLPITFADQLPASLQTAYRELWQRVMGKPKRYVTLWKQTATADAAMLTAMQSEGVIIDASKQVGEGSLYLVTTDPAIAVKYDMHPEDEFFFN